MAIAALASWGLALLFGLPQGYWATITAILVVQTSVGGALAVSRDRLIGTLAGAVAGALAVYLMPADRWGEGAGLALAVCALAFAAAKTPRLRIGPVTAAIVILAGGRHGGPVYAAERVGEIMLGSFIGVATTLFVFPARARQAAVASAAGVLSQLDELFGLYVSALAEGQPAAETSDLNAKVRASLGSLETNVAEAEREEQAHLGAAHLPAGLSRTLWRVRNDAVVIGRSLSRPFAPPIAGRVSAPAQALLEAARAEFRACASALLAGTTVGPSPMSPAAAAFREAFQGLRHAGVMRGLEFEEIGHVFGLAWAFEGLERNLADLADRIDETASGRRTGKHVVDA